MREPKFSLGDYNTTEHNVCVYYNVCVLKDSKNVRLAHESRKSLKPGFHMIAAIAVATIARVVSILIATIATIAQSTCFIK